MNHVTAVVMAGGLGTRLARTRPSVPKPLVEVGGVSLLRLLLGKLVRAGCRDIRLALRHHADLVMEEVRCWHELPAASIRFEVEDRPLGTIGALAQLRDPRPTVLTLNCDILFGLELQALLGAHRAGGAELTIATHAEHHRLELGEVVTGPGGEVRDYLEKPVKEYRISSGIYVLEPSVLALLSTPDWLPFPDLVRAAVRRGLRVREWFHTEPWIDVNDEAGLRAAENLLAQDPVAFGVDPAVVRQ